MIAFPVGELGMCYHEFWAPTNHMQTLEELQEQVLDFIPKAPPQYTKTFCPLPRSMLLLFFRFYT